MAQGGNIWVIDTSSIIAVRRIIPAVPARQRRSVFSQLDGLVADGSLVYPIQVVKELGQYTSAPATSPDLPYQWAKKNQLRATRHGRQYTVLKEILAHPQVKSVVDPDKIGTEEADPYVLALAVYLKSDHVVTVLTEERKDRPDKLSMNTACGLLQLFCLSMEAFLAHVRIWP